MSKLRVGVLFGGRSGEHEVSLRSARSVIDAFDPERYEIVPIGIDKQGRWLLGEGSQRLLAGSPPDATSQSALVATDPVAAVVPRTESLLNLDVVFPVLHGPLGEDGTVQGLLELAGVPYVGCGVLASSVAMDKAGCKTLFAAHELPQVPYLVLLRKAWDADPDAILGFVESQLAYPVFVKPANLGSSVGVSKAVDRSQLAAAIREAARYDRKLVVEAGIDAREIEVSVLGNDDPIASVPGEIVPAREYYDYAAKYITDDSALLIPAPLTDEQRAEVQRLAVQAFRIIDGAGMARVDFLMDRSSGALYINEINTIPGFTSISMYPKLWAASGLPFTGLVDRLVELAVERQADRARSETSYTPSDQARS
ncbi:MAG: D-alanine--D-alanine ligase family protein [Caldilineales bacterium]